MNVCRNFLLEVFLAISSQVWFVYKTNQQQKKRKRVFHGGKTGENTEFQVRDDLFYKEMDVKEK